MKSFLILLALFLAGCAPKGVVPGTTRHVELPAVPQARAVDLAPAAASSAVIGEKGREVAVRVESISKEVSGLKLSLRESVMLADKLRQQKTATEAELKDLWAKLTLLSIHNDRIENEAKYAAGTLNDQRIEIEVLGKKLEANRAESQASETEKVSLRSTLAAEKELRRVADRQGDELAVKLTIASEKADKLSGEIRIYRIVLGVILAAIVIAIIVKIAL